MKNFSQMISMHFHTISLLLLSILLLSKSHPLSELILRPEQSKIESRDYINLILNRTTYIETFTAFGHCYPKDIEAGKCCPNLLPNEKFVPNEEGWELIDYGISTASEEEREGVFINERNHYAIFRNDLIKKIIITFPGTKREASQGIREAVFGYLVNFKLNKYKGDIKLTKYFGLRSYLTIRDLFKESNLKNMRLDQNYQIIFTGHSLGGAMAVGTMFFALDQGIITREGNHPVAITFGQPRTGNEEFALTVQREAEVIYRHTNYQDPVHQIPFYSWGGRQTQGRIFITGDDKEYFVESDIFEYDVDKIEDSQEYNVFDIVKYLIFGMHRHVYYYGIKLDGLCEKH